MRFLGDILELIVKNPLTSQDRKNKLQQAQGEVYALWAFSPNFDPTLRINIVERAILYQEQLKENMNMLNQIVGKLKSLAGNEMAMFLEVMGLVSNLPLSLVLSKLEKAGTLGQIRNALLNTNKDNTNIKPPSTYDEVLDEINKDLENLKSLIELSVINAVNAEKAFVNSTSIYVRNIVNKLNSEEYLEFVKRMYDVLSVKGLEVENEKILKMVRLGEIYTYLKETLKTLEGGL